MLSLSSWIPSQIEEVPGELMQEDLATDDVMLLDTWDQVSEGLKVKALWPEGVAAPRLPALRLTDLLWKSPCCTPCLLSEPPFLHLQKPTLHNPTRGDAG